MAISRSIKKSIEDSVGIHLFRTLPRGIKVFHDIKTALPDYTVGTIFDVGANIGQSAVEYAKLFPSARIYSFEPVSESFGRLQRAVAGMNNVKCFHLAISSYAGGGNVLANGTSTVNHLVTEDSAHADLRKTEVTDVTTIDKFCEMEHLSHLHYLKIDTEGGDFEVLLGAEEMLKAENIDFIEVEAGMNPQNKYHVPMETFKRHLEGYCYYLFGLYEQVHERPPNETCLRRANLVFVSNRLIRAGS